ncbi:MAG: oligosaccharide flippase family protein [Myxococcales bacterium]|nr:oligosaccharide flippase family protein [Myxococcales bacterium]
MSESILKRARPLMIARALSAALTLAVPAILARFLVPASYGTFKQAWLIAGTLAMVIPMGAASSLYYFVPREPEHRTRFVSQSLVWSFVSALFAAFLILAGKPLIDSTFSNEALSAIVPWIALVTFFWIAGSAFEPALTSLGQMRDAAIVRVLSEVLRGLAMVIGAVLTQSSQGLFIGIAVVLGVKAICCFVWLIAKLGFELTRADFARQLGYALPLGAAFLLIIPQQQFHQYAVAAHVTPALFALYSVGCFQLPIVEILYTPVSEVLQIGLGEDGARDDPRQGLLLFHEAISHLSFAFLPSCVFLFLCARQLLTFVFTEQYEGATPIFRLSLITILASSLPLDGVMRARAQNRFLLALSIAKLAATVPLVLLCLRLLGPIGALLGFLVVELFGRFVMLARSARLFGATLSESLPLRELGSQALAAGCALPLSALCLSLFSGWKLMALATSGIAFAGVYLVCLWKLGALPMSWLRSRVAPSSVPSGEVE